MCLSELHLFRALQRALGKIAFTAAAHNLLDGASDAIHIMLEWPRATFALNIEFQ